MLSLFLLFSRHLTTSAARDILLGYTGLCPDPIQITYKPAALKYISSVKKSQHKTKSKMKQKTMHTKTSPATW